MAVGDEVLAFRISGGWATEVTVAARDVFAKPSSSSFGEAANLLLAGCTASDMLRVTDVGEGDTILVHGASGAVGVMVLQQAALVGARVIGTARERNFDVVTRFGGVPVTYGDGLEQRVREAAPDGIAAALDCVGTDEAVDVSLALVADRARIVTIAAQGRAKADGFTALGGAMPASVAHRDAVRADLVRLAGEGRLVVPDRQDIPARGRPGGRRAAEQPAPGREAGPRAVTRYDTRAERAQVRRGCWVSSACGRQRRIRAFWWRWHVTPPTTPRRPLCAGSGVRQPWRLGDTGRVRLHHRWDDDEDRPQPDLTEAATAAALTRAARDVRLVKLIHLAMLALGTGLLALALVLRGELTPRRSSPPRSS